MSRADTAARILDAAVALGTRDGVGALTLQGIATESGVSKALVLYHHRDKDALLLSVAERLAGRDAAAILATCSGSDAVEGWRRVAGDSERRAERALLAALLQERALQPAAAALLSTRAQAAAVLVAALLAAGGMRSRIAGSLTGRVAVQLLDGIAVTTRDRSANQLDAELDATALALMGLGGT